MSIGRFQFLGINRRGNSLPILQIFPRLSYPDRRHADSELIARTFPKIIRAPFRYYGAH